MAFFASLREPNLPSPARSAADCPFSALPKAAIALEPAAKMPHAVEPGVANDPQPVEDRSQVADNLLANGNHVK